MLYKLGTDAQAGKDRVKACRADKAMAKKAADITQATVEELKARLAEVEKDLAVKAAKLEEATSALETARTKHASLAAEGNRLQELLKTPVPGNSKEDEAITAIPERLVADTLHVVEKSLCSKA